jgi:uncharacterized protein YndB with AHSA1/START domain
MREVSATAVIPAPADELFGFIAEPTNLPAWQTGIVAAQRTTPDPVGVGSRATVVRELMGQRLSVELVLTGYEPGRRLVLESGASGIEVVATLELEPEQAAGAAAGTRLRFGMTIRAQNVFMTPVEGMVASAAEQDLANSLERLRAHFAQA